MNISHHDKDEEIISFCHQCGCQCEQSNVIVDESKGIIWIQFHCPCQNEFVELVTADD